MNFKYMNRYIALGLFLLTLTMYRLTSQSSVAFWDCGEYAATSPAMEVPHPPGAPLFTLLGRVAMMTPYVSDPALRINLISALASALTIMFLYLISVKIISRWKGFPSDLHSGIAVFGPAIIGALTFSVTDTFWFNAAESSLFASSMFFVSCVLWLGMTWYDKAEEPGSQRYLLLAAYLMGLSIGIHQLSILGFFAIALLIYFRYYEFEWKTFAKFGIITVLSFFIIYPGIVKWFVEILNGDLKFGPLNISHNILIELTPPAIIIAAIYGAYKAEKARRWILSTALMAGLLMVLGYSTYATVYIRANAHPPINENNPSNLARMVTYLNREQYGEQKMWPRMWSSDPQYVQNYKNYSSDFDYFWSYQLNHMYLRYLGFNFIGRAGDIQDAPVAFLQPSSSLKSWFDGRAGYPTRYFAIPLLLALFGIWYHFKNDWKFGLVFLALFAVLGFALVVFFNMQNPQPRERDYFFVGSFFVFAMWVGVGASGIIDLVTDALKSKQELWSKYKNVFAGGTAIVLFAISPLEMFSQNLYSHNRHGNFAPFDYSYNILQSCKPNAILFTNGDNDTFPLWYLQEGMGIRDDIRIVNLSLVNTDWYILQLKNETPHGAMKVPISIPDDQIKTISPVQWRTQTFKLPVSKEAYAQFGITDTSITNKGYIQYTMRPTLQAGDVQAIRVQDIIMKNIIETNAWKRPIYYAVTVAPDNFIGLTSYLQMQGLALQLTPKMNTTPGGDYEINLPIMKECLMEPEKELSTKPQYGFLFKNLNDPHIFYDDNVRNLMVNYRYSYLRLAAYYEMHGDSADAVSSLDTMEARMPNKVLPIKYEIMSDITRLYYMAGATKQFHKYADIVEKGALAAIQDNPNDVQRYYNPYRILLDLYDMEKDYQKSIDLLQRIQAMFPNDHSISQRITELQSMMNMKTPAPSPDTSLLPKAK
jgi:hypothetical protein